MELIRGIIVISTNATLEIRVPSYKARQTYKTWTRLQAAGKVLAEIGLEVEGANRIEIRPAGDEHSLMIWHEFPGEDNRASRVFRTMSEDRDG